MDDATTLNQMLAFVEQHRTVAGGKAMFDKGVLTSLEGLELRPWRQSGSIKIADHESFVRLVGSLTPPGGPHASVYYERTGQACAVLNDHTATEPGWRDWRIYYKPESDPSWTAWDKKFAGGRWCGQLEFAEFVQERALDFLKPTASEMLEIAQSFDVTRGGRVKSAVRLDNGSTELRMEKITENLGSIAIPNEIALGMRVFADLDAYSVKAYLRYRVDDDGRLSIRVAIVNADLVVRAATEDVVTKMKVGLPNLPFYCVEAIS